MKRKSKKEMVLEIYDREAMGEVTARDVAVINQGLIAEFGAGGALDPGEIARILVDEDIPVRFEQIFRMTTPAERYESLFRNLPRLDTLEQARDSIRKIDEFYRKFQRLNDQAGIRYARQTALEAKRQASETANDPTILPVRRAAQEEIAQWFTIWLQTPDLFAAWLELRQATSAYREMFGAQNRGPEQQNKE
jgi:hypothetical protein